MRLPQYLTAAVLLILTLSATAGPLFVIDGDYPSGFIPTLPPANSFADVLVKSGDVGLINTAYNTITVEGGNLAGINIFEGTISIFGGHVDFISMTSFSQLFIYGGTVDFIESFGADENLSIDIFGGVINNLYIYDTVIARVFPLATLNNYTQAYPNRVQFINSVPEPSTIALLGLGLAALGFRRKRR